MFCAPIKFLQYFWNFGNVKPGGCLGPLTDVTGGGQTTSLFKILKVLLKLYYCTKHAYIFQIALLIHLTGG